MKTPKQILDILSDLPVNIATNEELTYALRTLIEYLADQQETCKKCGQPFPCGCTYYWE